MKLKKLSLKLLKRQHKLNFIALKRNLRMYHSNELKTKAVIQVEAAKDQWLVCLQAEEAKRQSRTVRLMANQFHTRRNFRPRQKRSRKRQKGRKLRSVNTNSGQIQMRSANTRLAHSQRDTFQHQQYQDQDQYERSQEHQHKMQQKRWVAKLRKLTRLILAKNLMNKQGRRTKQDEMLH